MSFKITIKLKIDAPKDKIIEVLTNYFNEQVVVVHDESDINEYPYYENILNIEYNRLSEVEHYFMLKLIYKLALKYGVPELDLLHGKYETCYYIESEQNFVIDNKIYDNLKIFEYNTFINDTESYIITKEQIEKFWYDGVDLKPVRHCGYRRKNEIVKYSWLKPEDKRLIEKWKKDKDQFEIEVKNSYKEVDKIIRKI